MRIIKGKFLPKQPNIQDIKKWALDTKKETGFRPPVDEAFKEIINLYRQYLVEDLNPQQ